MFTDDRRGIRCGQRAGLVLRCRYFMGIYQAMQLCLRWPADVVRHSLRAGPALLASILQLRTALKA